MHRASGEASERVAKRLRGRTQSRTDAHTGADQGADLLLLIVGSLVVFSLVIDNYLSGRFFNRVTQGIAVTAVMAAGQSLVIITRNIDLSVGSIAGVSAYLTGDVLGDYLGTTPVVAVLLAVADRDAARLRQRPPRRLRADPLDHRHAGHAGDLPDVADQLRRGAHDHGQLAAAVARRPAPVDRVLHR